ncbi:adenylosuccinate lyase [Muribaculum sp. NM65_B17]|jgi:adenylosuccinate lyase|uniref:adenylosuccinate lyase n=3 Tax=Muribaculum TaxID=1918540 RepID=UPI00109351C7|nr:adenylosuccinate lyase [Muribaculum sp. NM65_B17]TGY04195.1 adenylosuccinate lyase [Muribaculum sp. NM65_B17]THG43145.1 adenylosuccinate lyase [Muribaculaceae bacterium]
MQLTQLTAISPIDGRYRGKCERLDEYFSEFALIRYRVRVEIEYFIALCEIPLPQLAAVNPDIFPELRSIYKNFTLADAERIKSIESVTNHDVKAVEYFLKERWDALGLESFKEFIHFGLTSQDINNTSVPLSIKEALEHVYRPLLMELVEHLEARAEEWKDLPMLAKTHGQPASPTRLGKEIKVFSYRLRRQIALLDAVPVSGKFGGATGNFNAHLTAYPSIDWRDFAARFLNDRLGIEREEYTTQISNYDNMAAIFDALRRINTIILDLDKDMWQYISMEYFKQKIKAGEVGSSAMPHKVNPIDFENSEGNLGIANAVLDHLAMKLPVSRLQRDLTDSTVLRNIGVPLGHMMIALSSTLKGLNKLLLNEAAISRDLDNMWNVVAEGIQTILRREGYPKPYETLKELTRVNTTVTAESIASFIDTLNVSDAVKEELKRLSPHSYTGY